jgi:uncharacterized RDD family membrane protein YckC
MRATYSRGAAVFFALALAAVPALAQEQPENEPVIRTTRPVVRVGQGYIVRSGDVVSNVASFLGDVTINGRVDDEVVVMLGSAHLGSNAVINGAMVVIGGTVTVEEGAAAHGDFVVVGGVLNAPPGFFADGTQVVIGTPAVGETLRGLVPWVTHGLLLGRLIVPGLWWIWMVVGVVFLVGLLVNTLFDRPVRACADAVASRPFSSFLLGLFVLLVTPVALVILAASVIGIVVVPFVVCAIVAAAIVGKVAVARAIGGTLTRESAGSGRLHALAAFAIGFALLCVAYMVPIVGIVTWAITGALGLGAAAITFRVAMRREHPARPQVPQVPVPPPPVYQTPPVYDTPPPAEPVAYEAVPPAAVPEPPVAAVAAPPPVRGPLAGYARAAFLDRVAAFALDCILVAIAIEIVNLNRYDGAFVFWLLVYHIAFWAWKGTTLGGIVVGLRIVRTQGTDLRVVDAVVRGLASIFSVAALGIGCLWMLQDPERQMWHDKIAGTYVIKVPRELLLADRA